MLGWMGECKVLILPWGGFHWKVEGVCLYEGQPAASSTVPKEVGMDVKAETRVRLDSAHPRLNALSHRIHAHPELGFEEEKACGWLADILADGGFDVETGICELDTALMAKAGKGPLHVAICAEYDALPGIGHACGHNIIAAMSAGAGLALAGVADDLGLTVHVVGTPAEEVGDGGGKILLLERGAFAGVHAAMMVHPTPFDALDPRLIGMVSEYLGYVPILSMVNFWYNPNSFIVRKDDLPFLSDRAPALLGHLDWADNTLVKVFIHCSSVTESNGPVVVLNPQDSARIRDKANYRYANIKNTSDDPCETNGLYLDDGIIRTHLNGAPKTMPLVGEPGTVYVADTSRCFHYGGRNTSTDEERLLGVLLYLRPGALKLSTKYEEILPLQHLSSPSLPLIDRLVLGENINS